MTLSRISRTLARVRPGLRLWQAKVLLWNRWCCLISSRREIGLILIPKTLIAEIKLAVEILLIVKAAQVAGVLAHTTI